MKDDYPQDCQALIKAIYQAEGFYRSLPPVDGSLKALEEIDRMGHEAFICTSPLLDNPSCITEKMEWVEAYLGQKWVDRMVTTKDKTIVLGDLLIDDKPEITGIQFPT